MTWPEAIVAVAAILGACFLIVWWRMFKAMKREYAKRIQDIHERIKRGARVTNHRFDP